MICPDRGRVIEVLEEGDFLQRVVVSVFGGIEVKAVNYPPLTGACAIDDEVMLNSTARLLDLGSGGWDFITAVLRRDISAKEPGTIEKPGHLMKLRYTPTQVKVLAWDEEDSAGRPQDPVNYGNLAGRRVLIAGVHSLFEPAVRALHYLEPEANIVYIMTDGAALPIWWSQMVKTLKSEGVIKATITSGHAFGGDYEALNNYSALACAVEAASADYIFVSMGPGIPGTGTKYGSTALEVGDLINAVATLEGQPIAIPRISQADSRPRHYGLSHHYVTAVREIAYAPAQIPLPYFTHRHRAWLEEEVRKKGLDQPNPHGIRHEIHFLPVSEIAQALSSHHTSFRSMGRGFDQEPLHFGAALAAALLACTTGPKEHVTL